MPSRKAKDVDEYIASASEATRPILVKLRHIFRRASPKLREVIKWNVPCFEFKGPVGGFAAFKGHVTWALWKAAALDDPDGLIGNGILKGGKIASVADVPPAAKMIKLIQQAIALNEAGIKPVTPDPELPTDFVAALKLRKSASKHFKCFTPARKWQYVNWIAKAKKPETRVKRIDEAINLINDGKTIK